MKPSVLVASLVLMTMPLVAEPSSLSLQDAIDMALVTSQEVRGQSMAADAALRDLEQSWNLFLPSIGTGLSGKWSDTLLTQTPISASTSGPFGATLSLGTKLTMTTGALFDLRKRRTEYQATELAAREAKARLVRDVEKAYFMLVSMELDLDNKAKAVALADERRRLAAFRFERGLGSELDALRAQMSELNARTAHAKAVADYRKKQAAFKRQLGLVAESPLTLTTALEIKLAFSVENLDALLASRIDLEKSRLAIEVAANATERYIATNRLPLVTLEADWNYRATGLDEMRDTLSLSAALAFNPDAWIPGSRKDLELRALRETQERLAMKYEQDRRTARDEVETILLDLELARNGLQLSEAQISLAERIAARTREAWERGSATALELEAALYDVDAARQALIASQYQYLSLLVDLGYALNTDWRTLTR